MFSFVDGRTRNKLKLPLRATQKRAVVKHSRNAWINIYSPELTERVKSVRYGKATSQKKLDSNRERIRNAVGTTIPLGKAEQKQQLLRILKLVDALYFQNTIEDGLAAWIARNPSRRFVVDCRLNSAAIEDDIVGLTTMDDLATSIGIDYATLFEVDRKSSVGKIKCKIKVDCLILLVEHEALHAFCFLFFEEIMRQQGPHCRLYQILLKKICKQLTVYHDL
jgi:hypothetical protein